MQRYGKTSTGKQRWRCAKCRVSSVRNRPDVHIRHLRARFIGWLTGTDSLADIAHEMSLSRKQLSKRFKPFWTELPLSPHKCTQNDIVLVFDGVYLSGRTNAVLIARTMQNVHSWHFAERESFEAWDGFLKQLSPPEVVVIDGQKGLLKAVLRQFPQTQIQRCLVHVERFVRMCLSRNPKTEAGRQLWALVRSFWNIQTGIDAETWTQELTSWEAQYTDFLMERSRSAETGRWWYTHRKLRAARSHLKKSLPYLFTFTKVSGVPRTTNHVEGGVNARLKELVRRHRGLSPEKKRVLAAHFLALKTTQKPTRKVT